MYDETWAENRLKQTDRDAWEEKFHDGQGVCWGESEWCHYFVILNNWLGYIFGLWSRLGEIGVRTTFIAFTSTAALLFQELDDRIEEIAKKSEIVSDENCATLSSELDEWRSHYDLLCELVQLINRCFGFSLLLITGHDFATSIFEFNNILDHIGVSKGQHTDFNSLTNHWRGYIDYVLDKDDKLFLFKSDAIKSCQFAHPVLRFFVILVTSHNLNSKVKYIKYYCKLKFKYK